MADEPLTLPQLEEEPPTGSVVAINWGGYHQEVWVSNNSNIGNWYCPDIPMRGDWHPHWEDVKRRAEGHALTLLVPGDRDAYAAGFDAGVARVGQAVTQVIDETRVYSVGHYPETAANDSTVGSVPIQGDGPVAALARIKKTHADANRLEAAGNMDGALLLSAVLAGEVPRLLTAVEAVLELASGAKATSWGATPGSPVVPVAWNLDPEAVRAAVLAALTGKEAAGHG